MSEFVGQMLGQLAQLLGVAQGAAGGGLTTLLAQLENAGLGERVRSWIGHGENLPVTEEELARAFTPEQLQAWAKEAGTTPEALLKVLVEALPRAVDHATPHGTLGEPRD
ncbi:MAG: DUF937 domain-containing protein [Rhodospirillales bacterium]|nr:DUF937 domain-containing protein [Rhodospirillales bacterium]MDE2200144.1 DUF937 domain-containing protein [Rhodospirillales bacterium]MDE2575961.1 DUF937 domain-containing protein [Rhodospirillales bacterium]